MMTIRKANDMDEEEDYTCAVCVGTGISATGRTEDACNACNGTGEARRYSNEQDYEPPDDDVCDSYEAEVIMWAGQDY